MPDVKSNSGFVFLVVVIAAVWLITRFALKWAPAAGWVNVIIGIAFFVFIIGSVVFLLRMAKNIGKPQ